jgi:zinc transporter, ZIP family
VIGRLWLLGVPIGLLVAVVVIVALRGPAHADNRGESDEVSVSRAILRPGEIELVLVNDSEDTARVAQAIVSDAYVDFRATSRIVEPDESAHVTLLYPWVEGESYEVELLLSPDGAVEYEIEDAGAEA